MDATPNYFMPGNSNNQAMQKIANMYGKERLKRATFAVLLCDPIQRAQSAWYHFHRGEKSFRKMLEGEHGHYQGLIWTSGLYDTLTKEALRYFGELVIIPSLLYFADAADTIKKLIEHAKRRNPGGVTPKPTALSAHSKSPAHSNSHPHPKLQSDINSADAQKLATFYRESICNVYGYVYGNDHRAIVLPRKPMGSSTRFLETSAPLKAHMATCRYVSGGHAPWAPSIPARLAQNVGIYIKASEEIALQRLAATMRSATSALIISRNNVPGGLSRNDRPDRFYKMAFEIGLAEMASKSFSCGDDATALNLQRWYAKPPDSFPLARKLVTSLRTRRRMLLYACIMHVRI
eukprot:CAMPEP_0119323386 /NCGR_PEP_ID=MMETSP1333-20130426/60570_1 /TAXON_ID=418940 /ORGANISM="Scyphosphaera apsteinii, Strain RCC1455" /LENGTH=347 /DNA_ID=CAMNT_0007330815 /DNA_START=423 /DNA_END=1468 /DNA_ORIENTATION=+